MVHNRYMSPIERKIQLKVLISDEEKEWLTDLADAEGVSTSDLIRKLIRRARVLASQPAGPHPLDIFSGGMRPLKKKPKK